MAKSKSPFLKTGLLAAAAIAMGAYIFLVEWNRPAVEEKAKPKVFTLDKAKVQEVVVEPKGGETVRLVKEGDAWKLTAPFTAPADATEADSLVQTIESLEVEDEVTRTPASLAEYGLESPRLAVSVKVDGAKEPLKVLLGDKVPARSGVYAKLPAEPRVFTIPGYVEGSLERKPFDLRDRDLLHVKREAVKSLDVTGPESYALVKDAEERWTFTRPISTLAGRWSVDGVVGNLEALRFESVAADDAKDLKPFGLDKPKWQVVLGLTDGKTKTLEIGSSPGEGKLHAREAGSRLVGVIPAAIADDLAKGLNGLRAKRLLDVAVYDVEGFDVEADGAKKTYVRTTPKTKDDIDQGQWKRTAPDAKDVDSNKIQDALFAVGGVEVLAHIDKPAADATYGLDAPVMKVALRFAPGKPATTFEVGKKDGVAYARRAGDTSVLKLDVTKADEVAKAFKEL